LFISQDPGKLMRTNLAAMDVGYPIAIRARSFPGPAAIGAQPFMRAVLNIAPKCLGILQGLLQAFTFSRTKERRSDSERRREKRGSARATEQRDRHDSILLLDSMRMCARQPVEFAGVR
jgi:hypothetical protein